MIQAQSLRALLAVLVFAMVGCAKNEPPRLTVLTYNIHHGVGEDNVLSLPRIAEVINRNHPDLVAIQEVDKETKRVGGIDEQKELSKLTGMHGVFGKAMDYDGGEYGQVILSRFEMESSATHMLPGTKGREPRIAAEARVRPGGGLPAIVMMGTHLDHQIDAERTAQAKEIVRVISGMSGAEVIIAGDMNTGPEGKAVQMLRERFNDTTGEAALTYPAPKPDRKIDWVFVGNGWRVVRSRVLDEPAASDHRPVVVELEWVGR